MRPRLLALILLSATPAAAQPFRITGSSPADGAAGVPLVDTLALTFSEPVQPASPAIVTFPSDSVQFGAPAVSPDGLTLRYPVTHTAGTRFVHLVLDAEAVDGTLLERPFAIAYTTSATTGSFAVSGVVSAATGSTDAAIVALIGLDATGNVLLADAAVLEGATGTYALGPVPFGVYTAGAVRLPHADPDRTFAYGFYDPDGDGAPNPVLIPFNVDFSISEPLPVLARARFDDAVIQAQARAADAAHFEIAENPVDTTGRAPVWTYTFYSATQDSTIQVVETGIIPLTFAQPGHPEGLAPILDGWVDSDVALAAAEGAGGGAFRAAHSGELQTVTLRSGLQHDVPTAATPAHRVAYRAFDPTGGQTDSLLVWVHIFTGEVIATTSAEPAPSSAAGRLEPPAPNPSRGPVAIAFVLDAATRVRLEIVDVLGRRAAVLVDEVRGGGRHVLSWDASRLPGGAYLVRLATDQSVDTRTVVIRR